MKNTHFRLAASFFLLLGIGLEVNHSLIRRVPWKGFDLAANLASIPLVVFWGLALAGLWAARSTQKPWMVVGIFLLAMHGIVLSTGGNRLGLAYLFSGLIAGICSAFAHAGKGARIGERSRPKLKLAS
jgi:hypothetical protein